MLFFLLTFLSAEALALVSKQEIEGMGYNKLQKLRFAYIEFMMRVELDEKSGRIPDVKKKTTTFQRFWNELLINHAYAIAPDGSLCFFGGWPSKMSHGKCSRPWSHKGDEEVKRLGAYDNSQVCGGATKFRCNPTLFGSPKDDGKGICVDIGGTFNHLTEKCERASRALVPKIIEKYQADPSAIVALGVEIKSFCDSYEEYDSCDDLNRRIKEITGEDLGTYKANGSEKPGEPAPVVSGGRSRNVSVVGEHLRPGGDLDVRTSNTGAQVLNRCQNLLKDKADVQNRNILGVMTTLECTEDVGANLKSLDDFSKVVENTDRKSVVAKINAKAFEQNVLAMLANDIRFGANSLNLADKNALFNSLVSNAPELKKDPIYKEAFERAYKNLDEEAKAGRLYPFEPESTTQQFNNLTSLVNGACKRIRDNYTKKFGDPGMLRRFMDSDQHKTFFTAEATTVHREMDVLLSESVVGHLMSTSHFKKNVFDPSEDFVEECARNPSYQVIKQPVATATIRQGHNEMMAMMKDNLMKLNEREKVLKESNEDAEDVLADFLKTDSGIVNMTMDELEAEDQYRLGALICNKTNQILTNDKRWRYVDVAVGGVGIAAGVVLMATGIGSPIGVALTAASLGMAGYGGARAVHDYRSASHAQKAADVALAQRRESMQNYLIIESNISERKKDALIQGGLAVVSGFPPVRAIQAAKTTRVVPRGGFNDPRYANLRLFPAKQVPARSLAGKVAAKFNANKVVGYLKRSPFKVKSYRPKITFKKVLLTSIGVSIAWHALKPEEKVQVSTNVTDSFTMNGFEAPSAVMKDLDVSKLSLEESYYVLEQMVGGPLDEKKLEKFESLLQPEFHSDQPQALQEYILQEQARFNVLKERILALQEKE